MKFSSTQVVVGLLILASTILLQKTSEAFQSSSMTSSVRRSLPLSMFDTKQQQQQQQQQRRPAVFRRISTLSGLSNSPVRPSSSSLSSVSARTKTDGNTNNHRDESSNHNVQNSLFPSSLAVGFGSTLILLMTLLGIPLAAYAFDEGTISTFARSSHYFGMFVSVGILMYQRLTIRPYLNPQEENTLCTVNLFYNFVVGGLCLIGSGYNMMMINSDIDYFQDDTEVFWLKMYFFAIFTSMSVFNSVTLTRRSLAKVLGRDIYVAPIGERLANRMIAAVNLQLIAFVCIPLISAVMVQGDDIQLPPAYASIIDNLSWEMEAVFDLTIFVILATQNFWDALTFEENWAYAMRNTNKYSNGKKQYLYSNHRQNQQRQQPRRYHYNNAAWNNSSSRKNNAWFETNNYDSWVDTNSSINSNGTNYNYNSDGRSSPGYVPQSLRGETNRYGGNPMTSQTKFGGLMKVSDGIMPADDNVPVTDRYVDLQFQRNRRNINDTTQPTQQRNIQPIQATNMNDANTNANNVLFDDLMQIVPENSSEDN